MAGGSHFALLAAQRAAAAGVKVGQPARQAWAPGRLSAIRRRSPPEEPAPAAAPAAVVAAAAAAAVVAAGAEAVVAAAAFLWRAD